MIPKFVVSIYILYLLLLTGNNTILFLTRLKRVFSILDHVWESGHKLFLPLLTLKTIHKRSIFLSWINTLNYCLTSRLASWISGVDSNICYVSRSWVQIWSELIFKIFFFFLNIVQFWQKFGDEGTNKGLWPRWITYTFTFFRNQLTIACILYRLKLYLHCNASNIS